MGSIIEWPGNGHNMHEKTISSKMLYTGRILGLEVQDVQLANGKKALREIVRHRGAVAVLARRPDGKFVLVRQFRKPVEREMLEVVAGNREAGEDPEVCARRELKEETGYSVRRLVPLGFIFPSPGYVDERIDLFYAETEPNAGGVSPDEDEHLEVVLLDRNSIVEKIGRNEINDSKTLAAWTQFVTIVETGAAAEGTRGAS